MIARRMPLAVLFVAGYATIAAANPGAWKLEWRKTDFSKRSVAGMWSVLDLAPHELQEWGQFLTLHLTGMGSVLDLAPHELD